jgi:hypothetical protein
MGGLAQANSLFVRAEDVTSVPADSDVPVLLLDRDY